MGIRKPPSVDYTDMQGSVPDFSVDTASTSLGYGEVRYKCDWPTWYGYYKNIPELKGLINKKAVWVVGGGYRTDAKGNKILSKIRGAGKDTFQNIAFNMVNTYTIGGDFFAEKIKNSRGLINLKPLSPDIEIIANAKGIIRRYEQMETGVSWQPEEIFHLSWNRTANMFHGQGIVEPLEDIILMRNEAMNDLKKVFHRYVKPLWIVSIDTDDTAEIAAFKTKLDKTVENSENLIVPKDVVDNVTRMSIPQFSTLDPLPWIQLLHKQFLMHEGVPDVVLGISSGSTQAEAKVLYLGWEQVVKWNQKFIEDQILNQLGIKLKFNSPASLDPETPKGEVKKDGKMNTNKEMKK